ncbi:MAG: HEPN domain-containing protein [Coleofasciculus sp. S288]|nr:HEPN domain-containing protein [Coleofasciculus sp. S288]
MTPDQLELLLKASQSLSAARVLLDNGFPDYAASRAYYTMFYIAEAFLEGEEMSFSSHAAVISAFGREFARTGRVPVEFHQFLIRAQGLRNAGDYGQLNAVTVEQATEQINHAEQFLELAQNLIGTLPPNS